MSRRCRQCQKNDPIAVIDLFAGPGGLGEGFDQFRDRANGRRYELRLSIEKDPFAYETLLLRSFFRRFSGRRVPEKYYDYLRGKIDREVLFDAYPAEAEEARQKVWHATLGGRGLKHSVVRDRIRLRLGGAKNWVLLGGPPCQAYSIVGRSRMRSTKADVDAYESDHRHFLYKEYLRIIADHEPPVFVIENVKGLLSSVVRGKRTFQRILQDLQDPRSIFPNAQKHKALNYRLFPFSQLNDLFGEFCQQDYVIRAEEYGIPQARHRILVLGVRTDILRKYSPGTLRKRTKPIPVKDVIDDLPHIRSCASRPLPKSQDWFEWLESAKHSHWLKDRVITSATRAEIMRTLSVLNLDLDTGGSFVPKGRRAIRFGGDWFLDKRLDGFCNHEARSHMPSDLHRYLFAACFAKVHGRSPKLIDFPVALLPDHKNVQKDVSKTIFSDRFRVQIATRAATTITSHISKDGHYYIHPDPSQCRSLTVREAARLQTFPDNYRFEGSNTEQYIQVGNAVPPLLALQIAEVVGELFA
jgi:DNA (cytosine-5)-methyltransferase 1